MLQHQYNSYCLELDNVNKAVVRKTVIDRICYELIGITAVDEGTREYRLIRELLNIIFIAAKCEEDILELLPDDLGNKIYQYDSYVDFVTSILYPAQMSSKQKNKILKQHSEAFLILKSRMFERLYINN